MKSGSFARTRIYFTAEVLAFSGMFIMLVRKKARQDNEKKEKNGGR
ncbi:MAG TPA: hypothetical protein VMZ49_01080 [Patescibacteria group bacterium]|nr:hypothetical protein [Patescibacteria group bacterium]